MAVFSSKKSVINVKWPTSGHLVLKGFYFLKFLVPEKSLLFANFDQIRLTDTENRLNKGFSNVRLLNKVSYQTIDKKMATLNYRRVVVRSETSDDFSLRYFSKPSKPTELHNQELIENS